MRGVVRTIAACATCVMLIGSASAGVIEDRKQGFKANVAALKAIKAAVQSNNAKDAVPHANAVAAFADKMAALFPEGSGTGDTRSKGMEGNAFPCLQPPVGIFRHPIERGYPVTPHKVVPAGRR